jgi:hypothetical protein
MGIMEVSTPLFWDSVQRRQRNGERFGQAVFNTAYGLYPDIVGEVAHTSWDPYYNDERVNKFLSGLAGRLAQPDK